VEKQELGKTSPNNKKADNIAVINEPTLTNYRNINTMYRYEN